MKFLYLKLNGIPGKRGFKKMLSLIQRGEEIGDSIISNSVLSDTKLEKGVELNGLVSNDTRNPVRILTEILTE